MKNNLIVLSILVLFLSCVNRNTKVTINCLSAQEDRYNFSLDNLQDSLNLLSLISKSIKIPEAWTLLKTGEEGLKELVILDDTGVLSIMTLPKASYLVRVLTSEKIYESGTDSYFEYSSIVIKEDTAMVCFNHNSPRRYFNADYLLVDQTWELLKYSSW